MNFDSIIILLTVFIFIFILSTVGGYFVQRKGRGQGRKVLGVIFSVLRFMCICFSAVMLCFAVYVLIDNLWNGKFLDWFVDEFMIVEQPQWAAESGAGLYVYWPDWEKIKRVLLIVFIGTVLITLILVFIISNMYAKRKSKKNITLVSKMLRSYMTENKDASQVFPKEYAEISAQLSEIKAVMVRHEQALREENTRKNDLITYLAHDLKTPLTSVIGYLSFLDEAPDMPAEQKSKYVGIALDKAYRLESLVNEFFEIAHYNLHQIHLEKKNVDLYYMLIQMVDEFYPILSANGNRAYLNSDENITVYGDPAKLARVFNNLIKNAAAYSFPYSEILITTRESGGQIVVEVQNSGPTIPEDKLSAIFEKFYRMDEARTTDKGGAGLGLAIAKEIVDLHGGMIFARSAENVTTFTVSLPAYN